MAPVRVSIELILAAAGFYLVAVAVLLWWLGVRAFLRRFWEHPSARLWGPAIVDDYLLARAVARKLRWTPLRLRVFELLSAIGFLLLVAAAVLRYSQTEAGAQPDNGDASGGRPEELCQSSIRAGGVASLPCARKRSSPTLPSFSLGLE
ncbi:MAG: hypothetical protein KDM81_09670 [Verrucomicrobiae bacterium]|nr:hypothetical protein [Verrucomicrobiae bacterium]MCP5522481.1 hypothetical protein [Verrucomicrobiales bacterium]